MHVVNSVHIDLSVEACVPSFLLASLTLNLDGENFSMEWKGWPAMAVLKIRSFVALQYLHL